MSVVRIAANAATVLFVVLIVLQLLIAAGIFPITMAWGGKQQTLTVPLRIASLAAAVLLGFMAYVIRRRAGLIGGLPIPTMIIIHSWVTTAYMALNTVGNILSTSMGEKILFAPISFLLTLSCSLVSISKPNS